MSWLEVELELMVGLGERMEAKELGMMGKARS